MGQVWVRFKLLSMISKNVWNNNELRRPKRKCRQPHCSATSPFQNSTLIWNHQDDRLCHFKPHDTKTKFRFTTTTASMVPPKTLGSTFSQWGTDYQMSADNFGPQQLYLRCVYRAGPYIIHKSSLQRLESTEGWESREDCVGTRPQRRKTMSASAFGKERDDDLMLRLKVNQRYHTRWRLAFEGTSRQSISGDRTCRMQRR